MANTNKNYDFLSMLLVSLLLISTGVVMIIRNLAAVGMNSRSLQPSGFGGHYLILIGIIFMVVAYYSLSPFSKLRSFFSGNRFGRGRVSGIRIIACVDLWMSNWCFRWNNQITLYKNLTWRIKER